MPYYGLLPCHRHSLDLQLEIKVYTTFGGDQIVSTAFMLQDT